MPNSIELLKNYARTGRQGFEGRCDFEYDLVIIFSIPGPDSHMLSYL